MKLPLTVCYILEKLHLAERETKRCSNRTLISDPNKIPFDTDRGNFSLYSDVFKVETEIVDQFYFKHWKRHKNNIIIYYNNIYKVIYECKARSECNAFHIHLSPFQHCYVDRDMPMTKVFSFDSNNVRFSSAPEEHLIECTTTEIDFSKANMKTVITVSDEYRIAEGVMISLQQLQGLLSNNEKINYLLTGVEYDGEFHTSDGKTLIPDTICHRCGLPLFHSSIDGYYAQCLQCDEDFYGFEVVKVNHQRYEDILKNTKSIINRLLKEN